MNTEKTTLLVEFSYDGRPFHGLQPQPGLPTVGGALREALEMHFRQAAKALTFAARTDAGVSAEQNFATLRFTTTHTSQAGTDTPFERRVAQLKDWEPVDGLRVHHARVVPRSTNARQCATSKRYRYRIEHPSTQAQLAQATSSEQSHSWRIVPRLDVARMQSAAALLVGRHDFSAFRAANCAAKSPVKTLHRVAIEPRVAKSCGLETVVIEITGDAFLRKMVRILCGTLAEVGAGLRPVAWVRQALESRRRELAGLTAPACGLTLMEVTLPWPNC